MATKSYSEQAAATLFSAARQLRDIAGKVLDDSVTDVELRSERTHEWVKKTAAKYASRSLELEAEAVEVLGFYTLPRSNQKSRDRYSEQITAYQKRRMDSLASEAFKAVEAGVWSEA